MDGFDYRKPLQEHFSDGLAVIVGSGLSCAEGLAGMSELADHLNTKLALELDKPTLDEWSTLSELIAERGLEPALMELEPSEQLDSAIAGAVVECLAPQEGSVISDVVAGRRTLRFTKLVPCLLEVDAGLPILTTNYDRLVEVACEAAGLHVDTMFDGSVIGTLDVKNARQSLLRVTDLRGQSIRKRYRSHARVLKPHGSLDWYQGPDGPIRFAGHLNLPRLIVAPGRRKLRRGYDRPFDEHRETMNRLLNGVARLFVVGYGFNDDHLETRLTELIRQGKPTLMLTRTLSPRARSLATKNPSVTALERESDERTRMIFRGETLSINEPGIWDLGNFVDEVMKP